MTRAIPQDRLSVARWTPGDDAQAASLWRQGVSGGAIALALAAAGGSARSASSVIGRMRRLAVPSGHPGARTEAATARRERDATERRERAIRREQDRAVRDAAAAPRLVLGVPSTPRRVPDGTPLPESRRVRIEDLRGGDCRYIEGGESPAPFCEHRVLDGSSYCAGHHALCTEMRRTRVGPPTGFAFRTRARAA